MRTAINIAIAAALILACVVTVMIAPSNTLKTNSVRSMYGLHFGQRPLEYCSRQIDVKLSC